MMRNTVILLLAVAVLAAPAAAQMDKLRAVAAKYKKDKGGSGSNCGVGTPSVVYADGSQLGTTDHPFKPENMTDYLVNQGTPKLLNHYTTTFDCVDSREVSYGDARKHLGTLGGDFAELGGGIVTYCKVAGVECTAGVVKRAFERFMDKVATPSRPFYLHQAEDKINKALDTVWEKFYNKAGVRPASLPVVAPSDLALREAYIESLAEGSHQGCGHIRLIIDNFDKYGLESNEVYINLLKAFYEYWWPTPLGSSQRKKIDFPILQGSLEGDSVLIVNAAGKSGSCARRSPTVAHAFYGAQTFVYNGDAVVDWREARLAPFFEGFAKAEKTTFDVAEFNKQLAALQNIQLGSTLTLLPPANKCPILVATY